MNNLGSNLVRKNLFICKVFLYLSFFFKVNHFKNSKLSNIYIVIYKIKGIIACNRDFFSCLLIFIFIMHDWREIYI